MTDVQADSSERSYFHKFMCSAAAFAGLALPGCSKPDITSEEVSSVPASVRVLEEERASRRLILVGGGERPAEAMARFMEWSGGSDSRILIITWATSVPDESFESIKADLLPYDFAEIIQSPSGPEMPQKKEEFLQQLASATGVYFTGGDQSRIMEAADEEILDALQKRFKSGIVFAGTSAGTAVMSETMLTGETLPPLNGGFPEVETVAGLGLLEDIILDQHFIKRSRMERLIGALIQNPEKLGIGIDEDAAVSVEDNRYLRVLGSGKAIVIEEDSSDRFAIESLDADDEVFDLKRETRH